MHDRINAAAKVSRATVGAHCAKVFKCGPRACVGQLLVLPFPRHTLFIGLRAAVKCLYIAASPVRYFFKFKVHV